MRYLFPQSPICSTFNTPLKRSLLGGVVFPVSSAVGLHVPNALTVVEALGMVFCHYVYVCLILSHFSYCLKSSLMAGTLTFCIPVPCTKQDSLQKCGVNA